MRFRVSLLALGFICGLGCATSTSELGPDDDSGAGGFGGSKGGSGGFGGGKGGSGGTSASGGTSGLGGSGGSGGFGGSGGSSGSGGSGGTQPDASTDAADSGSASGFGDCVTQKDVDAQSTQPFQIGFCFNPFACFACSNDAVKPGDITCSPKCLCVPLPPICGDDAGIDAGSDAADAAETGDAGAADAADASTG